jgi:XTP/dITP diphosphohydrolase
MLDSNNKPFITFATSNTNKFREVKSLFDQTSIQLKHLNTTDIRILEIQSSNLEEIATFALKSCIQHFNIDLIFVEDSGIFIKELNNFPGPYSSYVLETIGLKGILTLMSDITDRKAFFQSSIAIKIRKEIKMFSGVVEGQISTKISSSGWGYDPIFIPESNGVYTFGELGSQKLKISHRYQATVKLIDYLKNSVLLVD